MDYKLYRKARDRNVTMFDGNISKVKFTDKWPNGRNFKHGAMMIEFVFPPSSRISAEADVQAMMENHGYERGKDYHIPAWNFSGFTHVRNPFYITFNDDETFVMAKMTWDLDEDDDKF